VLNVHAQGVQLLFLDGHGELSKYRDLRSGDFA